MIYSKKIERQAKKEKLTVDDMSMADLMCLGYADADAYLITHQDQKIYGEDYIKKQITSIVVTPEFIKYTARRNRAMKQNSAKIETGRFDGHDDDQEQLPDKEQLARELLSIARSLPSGSKERADIMMKYADLMQMKKDAIEEESTIHYYLPLSCDKCELYAKHKKEKRPPRYAVGNNDP